MRWGAIVAGLVACLLAPASGTAATAPPRELSYLSVGGGPGGLRQIVDAHGRTTLLRGVNVDGLVDYWRPDLRPPYSSNPADYQAGSCPADDPTIEGVRLCDFDFEQMRPLGYDAIRLNLSWSLLEPTPGRIDQTYIARVAQVVDWARRSGIYVVLDMHQDAWSKYLYSKPGEPCVPPEQAIRGFDGAPLWASDHTAPVCALNGVRELDAAVQEAFQRFYSDVPASDGVGLQEHYASVLVALAKRFAGDPAVAGYEIMNEPSPGFAAAPSAMDASELFPFYGKVVQAVTSQVPGFRQLFFIEPNTERNVIDQSAIVTPWSAYSSYPNVVYAPHIYTGVFTADQQVASQRFFPSDGGYRSAITDAQALGLPLWVGEFGNNPQDDPTILTTHYQLQDRYLLGGTLWLWKENANDTNQAYFWGVYGPPFGTGTLQPVRQRLTSRPFPLFTAGTLDSLSYDPAAGTFAMGGHSAAVRCGDRSRATVMFIPAAAASHGLGAEGAHYETFDRDGSQEAYIYPDGGAYTFHSGAGGAAGCAPGSQRLPPAPRCVDRRRFRFRIHQPPRGSVVEADVYVGRRLIERIRGRRVTRVVVRRLPQSSFSLRIVAHTDGGYRVVSTRRYVGCRKGRPRTVIRPPRR